MNIVHQRKNNQKGFTLIELLVVVALVGLLSTLVVIAVGSSRIKSYDTRRVADINDIHKALELYHSEQEVYPTGTDLALGEANARCLSALGFTGVCPGGGVRTYLAAVPANPEGNEDPYYYSGVSDDTSFTLEFVLKTTISDVTAGLHVLTPEGIR